MPYYPKDYHRALQDGALRSARAVVPLVIDLIRPAHVVDVGCGSGAWLSVFKEHGIDDVQGVDGDWVEPETLLFPARQFVSADLERPLQVSRQFDLVVSLEVAEHLTPDSAETFIDSLTRLGPVILFSAAVPFQGGTNHFNEQWPTYWVRYFAFRGYVALDCLRRRIWDNDQVEWWYAQNILFFVREDRLDKYPLLKAEYEKGGPGLLSVAHPRAVIERQKEFLQLQQHEAELLKRVAELSEEGMQLRQREAELNQQGRELRQRQAELLQRLNVLSDETGGLRQREAELLQRLTVLSDEAGGLRQREAELSERVNVLNNWGVGLAKQVADLEGLKPGRVSLKKVLRALPALIKHAVKRRM